MATSLKELAASLGLSQTTVSRALNGYPEVGEKTRRRVLEAAERANYRASTAARRLATGRANALGLVFSTERNILERPIVMDFLTGVSETAAREGLDIVLTPTRAGEEADACMRLATSGLVDALVLTSPILDEVRTSGIADLAFPIVAHGRPLHGQSVPYLSIDNFGGFKRGAQHLIALGHRRIGLVNGEARQAYAQDRTEGLGAALDEAGIARAQNLIRYGPLTFTLGYQSTLSILDEPQPPTALLASSVLVALGAMKALAERGLRVPQDMSIVAHDDEVAAFPPSMATPQLTTLNSSIRAAGARIAEMALERIASGGAPVASEVWPVPLTIRGSTAEALD